VKLLGENLNIHPLLAIIILYMGMKIFGLTGIIFGPILVITIRAIYQGISARETDDLNLTGKGRLPSRNWLF
jgi:predicted PurR-regulated permease PerM